MKQLGTILVLVMLCSGCNKQNAFDCFKSSGPEITQLRYPLGFTNISLSDKMDVTVAQGAHFRLEVTAGQNLLTEIASYVRNDTLFLENNNLCNFVRGYEKKIHIIVIMPYVRRIVNNGVGTIRLAEEFMQDTLVVRAESSGDIYVNGIFRQVRTSSHGNGDIYLNGATNSLYVYTKGTNYLRGEEMTVRDYVFVETASLGQSYINGSQLDVLECNIHDDGNIYYTGNPATNDFSDGTGKGRLLKKD
jgi:hypothetical protein